MSGLCRGDCSVGDRRLASCKALREVVTHLGNEPGVMPEYLIFIYAVVVGLCVGSFLNVCIYRLPASKSIVHPGSECPECGKGIRFYDNIPVVSYLILRGRCRNCHTRIPFRYALVEIITGLCAFFVVFKFGTSIQSLIYFVFIAALIVVVFIDIDHKIIPNRITLPGIPVCFAASFALPDVSVQESLLGILAGGGSLFVIAWGYKKITRKDGMGGGDIKLLAMIGALIGWKGVLFTIYFASIIGTCAGLVIILQRRKNLKFAIPFGPFLSLGATIYIFFGEVITEWYFRLLQ